AAAALPAPSTSAGRDESTSARAPGRHALGAAASRARSKTSRSSRQTGSLCARSPLLEDGDRWQRLALEKLEESAAARRDVGDAVRDAELLDRGERVAAACDRKRAARSHCLGD